MRHRVFHFPAFNSGNEIPARGLHVSGPIPPRPTRVITTGVVSSSANRAIRRGFVLRVAIPRATPAPRHSLSSLSLIHHASFRERVGELRNADETREIREIAVDLRLVCVPELACHGFGAVARGITMGIMQRRLLWKSGCSRDATARAMDSQ